MRTSGLALLPLVACAGTASAVPVPQVILSSDINASNSLVPGGWADERFGTDLGEIYRSPSGNRWISAFSTTFGRVGIITGEGAQFEVAFIATGGDELPWSTFDEPAIYDSGLDIDNGSYAINDAGDIAISLKERTAPPTRVIAKRVAGQWSTPVREGQDIPYDNADEVWGSLLNPFGLNQDGSEVYFRGVNTLGSLPDSQDEFIVLGSTVVQLGVTALPAASGRTFDNFGNGNTLRTGLDASSWIAAGNLSGATSDDDVIISDAGILAQEGVNFDGYVSRASRLAAPSISGNGQYATFRSQTAEGIDFVGGSDSVIAAKGDTVSNAPANTTWNSFTGYSRTFLSSDTNDSGQWIILGGTTTDGVNIGRIVSSFDGVLLSDRQPVDFDGDGVADDGVYADLNGGTGLELFPVVLGSDGTVFAVVRLVDSDQPNGGAFLGEAIIRLGTPVSACSSCAADFDANGGVDGGDLAAFFADFEQGLPCADVDGNGGVDGGDLGLFFTLFEAGGC